jgi:serpin B
MPKFKFHYSNYLQDALSTLGMGIVFSRNADFTGVNPTAPLRISYVLHKAVVDVDEDGTTAAAVTVIGLGGASAPQPPTVIDHPFIFAIREMKSGLILFVGTVNNPLLTGN